MRIVTWNINSVRLRAGLLQTLKDALNPDVICLQETKCPDEHFPHDAFAALGYPYVFANGMKSYNGVVIASREPFDDAQVHTRVGRSDCRHISVRIKDTHLHNLYVPAGGDIPDRDVNEKFGHKLDFMDELASFFPEHYKTTDKVIVVGDLNIAPLEHDVWSHKQLLDIVSHTPIEVEKFGVFQKSLNFVDAVRKFVPENEKCYSWWSYRNRDWRASNRGRRLDHFMVSKPLEADLKTYEILVDARDWERTSDHVPVLVELAL